jgi:hypothetical protein
MTAGNEVALLAEWEIASAVVCIGQPGHGIDDQTMDMIQFHNTVA